MFVLQTAEMSGLCLAGHRGATAGLPPMAPEVDLNLALEPPAARGAPLPAISSTTPTSSTPRPPSASAASSPRWPGRPSRRPTRRSPACRSRTGERRRELAPAGRGPGARCRTARHRALILERLRQRPEATGAGRPPGGETIAAGVLAGPRVALAGRLLARRPRARPAGRHLPAARAGAGRPACSACWRPAAPSSCCRRTPRASIWSGSPRTAGLTLALADRSDRGRLPAGVGRSCREARRPPATEAGQRRPAASPMSASPPATGGARRASPSAARPC